MCFSSLKVNHRNVVKLSLTAGMNYQSHVPTDTSSAMTLCAVMMATC